MKTLTPSYNPDNLEAGFKKHLLANGYSRTSIHNYLSDIRSFLSWFSHNLRSQHLEFELSHYSKQTIVRYIEFMKSTRAPVPNINRSLSSLRAFSRYLVGSEVIDLNPLTGINNIKVNFFQSARYWLKSNARPVLSFILGFIFISILFFIPGLVSSAVDIFSTTRGEMLKDVQDVNTVFPGITTASTSAGLLTIPIIDELGNLNLTAPYPKIIGRTGTLSIQSPELNLATTGKGNIKLQTKEGSIHFLFEGEKPNLPFESAFYFSGENMRSGALIYGEVEKVTDNVSLIELSSGSPSISKFRVDSEGNVYIKGNIILEGNLIINPESTIFSTFSSQTATSSASSVY